MRWYWIDRFIEFESGRRAKAIKNISLAEDHLHDHFPHFPIIPASLVIEGMAQAACILAYRTLGTTGDDTLFFFAGIDNARFRRQVFPGDQLVLESEVQRLVLGVGKFAVRAKVDGEIVAEADLLAAMRMPEPQPKAT